MKRRKKSLPGRIGELLSSDLAVNARLIALLWLFTGINCIGAGLRAHAVHTGRLGYDWMALGGVILLQCPLSLWDKRKEMRGTAYLSITAGIHLAMAVLVSWTDTPLWMAVYAGEVGLLLLAIVGVLLKRELGTTRSRAAAEGAAEWKFLWYTKTSFSELERKLASWEEAGWRVELVVLEHFFRVVPKKNDKQGSYFAVRYYRKETDAALYDAERELARRFRGNPVETRWSGLRLWRTTLPVEDAERFAAVRTRWFIHTVRQELLLAAFLLAGTAAAAILSFREGGLGPRSIYWGLAAMAVLGLTIGKGCQWLRLRRRAARGE